MLFIVLFIFTIVFFITYFLYTKSRPKLTDYLSSMLAFVSAIQSAKLSYLMLSPFMNSGPFFGRFLGTGFGIIRVPKELDGCFKVIGSDLDIILISLGTLSIFYISVKQVLISLMPDKNDNSSSTNSNNATTNTLR